MHACSSLEPTPSSEKMVLLPCGNNNGVRIGYPTTTATPITWQQHSLQLGRPNLVVYCYYGLDEDELESLINGGSGGIGGIVNQQQNQRQQSMDEQGVTFSIFHSFNATTPTVISSTFLSNSSSVTYIFYIVPIFAI
jgi:hypothetical protein